MYQRTSLSVKQSYIYLICYIFQTLSLMSLLYSFRRSASTSNNEQYPLLCQESPSPPSFPQSPSLSESLQESQVIPAISTPIPPGLPTPSSLSFPIQGQRWGCQGSQRRVSTLFISPSLNIGQLAYSRLNNQI